MERIILTTGGTGGHVFPALAVAEEIRRRNPRAAILFMGSSHGPEADMAAKAGLDFVGLPVKGVIGRGGRGLFAALGMIPSLWRARSIIVKFRPQVVLGFGGYASFCGIVAARLCGVPTAVHEQNSISGMSNRIAGKFAKRVFLSLPDAVGAFPPRKSVLVGNPVRASIAELYARLKEKLENRDGPPRLLVMGGSQGARAINDGVAACLPQFLDAGLEIRHQTGAADYERVRALYREAHAEHAQVSPFITDMRETYAWADLALCRAGGTSLAELMAAGLPAILVPFPSATHNHQYFNARTLEREGAAVMLEQKEFTPPTGDAQKLADTVLELIRNRERLDEMSEKCGLVAKPNAAAALVDGLEKIVAGA